MILRSLSSLPILYCLSWSVLAAHPSYVVSDDEINSHNNRWFEHVSLIIHLNGQPDPCGSTLPVTRESVDKWSSSSNKYQMETFLTDTIASILHTGTLSSCFEPGDRNKSLYSFCDRGPDLTPILLDHNKLIKTQNQTLPCRWYTREGLRITSVEQLNLMFQATKNTPSSPSCANPQDAADCDNPTDGTDIHLYAVPAGRVFMFAPAYVGEIFRLDHLKLLPDKTKPIYLEVLSTSPRVFDILNVFTPEEAEEVVERALNETSPTHRIKRSTTGATENSVFSKRTSENGFDTHGRVALALKQRIFEVLGYDEYWNGHDDGLQVLRYNLTQAYIQHDGKEFQTSMGSGTVFCAFASV
jgi:hypothetical protein